MASSRHIFVSGRWDSSIAVVDLDAALRQDENADAILSRPRVTEDVEDGAGRTTPAAGLPVGIVVARKLGRLAVINHAGNARPSEVDKMPHGHAGTVAVLDILRAAGPACNGNMDALIGTIPVAPGPVGAILMPDERHILVSSSEGSGSEDGGFILSLVDLASCTHVADFELDHTDVPSAAPSPSPDFGGYPNPCGIAFAPADGGLILVANGGTADVSVIPLTHIAERKRRPETGRVPISHGGFGIAVDPNGTLAAVCNRENPRTGASGESITLIDTRKALRDPRNAAVAEIAVGGTGSRPTGIAFSPGGDAIYISCTDTGTVSKVDRATSRETARQQLDDDGRPAMPRGIVTTADGRHLLVSGGRKGSSGSSSLWILDAGTLEPKARLRGVGNESYFLSGG